MAYRQPQPTEQVSGSKPSTLEAPHQNPPDTHIWGCYGCLVVLSIIELYSASSFEISKQGLYRPLLMHIAMLFAGFLIILGLQRVHYKHFINGGRVLFWGAVIAQIYVLAFGVAVNGAQRAIRLPGFTLQPSEFIKLGAVMMLAYILGTSQLKKDSKLRNRGLYLAGGLTLLCCGLLFTQGLTNTIILMAICVSMLVLGAVEWKKFWITMLVFACCGLLGVVAKLVLSSGEKETPSTIIVDSRGQTFDIPELANVGGSSDGSRMRDDTWQNRLNSYWEAMTDTTKRYDRPITQDNLQEMRSYMAQANGGWLGVFPGNSRETARLPLAFSDFIFAIIVEDLGFVGAVFILLLYLWLLARAYFIAYRCNQMYPAFLVTGCAMLIMLQALCHMAIVSGAGPVSGQPLPLFSRGGTSIIVISIAFGIMLSVSRYTMRDSNASRADLAREKQSLPEAIQAENPTQL